MLQKCLLTGAMCAIAPGSPVQLLVALLVCSAYLLLILHGKIDLWPGPLAVVTV